MVGMLNKFNPRAPLLLLTLLLFTSSLGAETQLEWQCNLAMEEYKILRQQALTGGSKCDHIEDVSARLSCRSGEGFAKALGGDKEAKRLKQYEAWISQNCF